MTKTVSDYEAELVQLEADIRQTATMVTGDPDLTPEGKKRRHAGWANERRWHDQFDTIATGLIGALEGAQATAEQARAAMTTMPTADGALQAVESRFQRRRARVDAALASGGTGAVTQLILDADDSELPVLVEYLSDEYALKGGDLGKAGAEIIDEALRQRCDEYAQAAKTAGAAGNALSIAREKIEYMRALLDDPATPPPGEYDYSGMSISGVVPAVADLTA